jgi:hypothetical protein
MIVEVSERVKVLEGAAAADPPPTSTRTSKAVAAVCKRLVVLEKNQERAQERAQA